MAITAAAIVAYAAIAAVVAASASTAIKAQAGDFDNNDGNNDAWGNFMKTLFISFAANTVAGGAGAAGEGASAGADAGMYTGMSNAEMAGMVASESGAYQAGVGGTAAASGAGQTATGLAETTTAASNVMDAGNVTSDTLAATQDAGSQFQADNTLSNLTGQSNQVMAEKPTNVFEGAYDWTSKFDADRDIFKWLSDSDDSINSMFDYSEEADVAANELGENVSRKPARNPALEQFAKQLGGTSAFGGFDPRKIQSFTQADIWEQEQEELKKLMEQPYSDDSFMGGFNFEQSGSGFA